MYPTILVIVTGLAFGIWPIVMTRSGLSGPLASTIWAAIVMLGSAVSMLFTGSNVNNKTSYSLAVAAGLIGMIGVVALNSALAKAQKTAIGRLLVLMMLAQICVPAIYQCYADGHVTLKHIFGFIFAIATACLLG